MGFLQANHPTRFTRGEAGAWEFFTGGSTVFISEKGAPVNSLVILAFYLAPNQTRERRQGSTSAGVAFTPREVSLLVTLSGGEPALFMDYTAELLAGLREMDVHTLLETCGLFDLAEFEEKLLPLVDTIYFDLKIIDPERHRELCRAPNGSILENFGKLHGRSLDGGHQVLPRVPLIPGITDTDENLADLARFLRDNSAARLALLQYNPLWTKKSAKIGKSAPAVEGRAWTSWMDRAELKRCRSAFVGFEIV